MFTLEQVVPWGRSFEEYVRMFALSGPDLQTSILGCGDGPASFNAEATRRGARVVSCDPIYRWDTAALRERIEATSRTVLEQTRQNAGHFVWTTIASVEDLGRVRMAAMDDFLRDYDAGREQGRYVNAELPSLAFADRAFDLALSSHLLFLYSAHLDQAFHLASVRELCRVAREVRIFPLLGLDGARSPFVDPCAAALESAGHDVSITTVDYEFQRGGNQMLRVRKTGGR